LESEASDKKSSTPSLSFVANSELMSRISETNARCDGGKNKISTLGKIFRIAVQQQKIVTTCGATEDFDLLIAADGTLSSAKITLGIDLNLQHRGYTVYRGHSKLDLQESFQTLGLGTRFAAVPAGRGGCNWFLATSRSDLMQMKFSQPESTDQAAFRNFSREVDYPDSLQTKIRNLLQNWHQPIDEILLNTDTQIYSCPGIASKKTPKNTFRSPKNIVFLGDAHHTFDPILAIGAGVALEGAKCLVDEIENQDDLQMALKNYQDKMEIRRQQLDSVSDLAQFFGHVESRVFLGARDLALKVTPAAVKGRVMDRFVKVVNG